MRAAGLSCYDGISAASVPLAMASWTPERLDCIQFERESMLSSHAQRLIAPSPPEASSCNVHIVTFAGLRAIVLEHLHHVQASRVQAQVAEPSRPSMACAMNLQYLTKPRTSNAPDCIRSCREAGVRCEKKLRQKPSMCALGTAMSAAHVYIENEGEVQRQIRTQGYCISGRMMSKGSEKALRVVAQNPESLSSSGIRVVGCVYSAFLVRMISAFHAGDVLVLQEASSVQHGTFSSNISLSRKAR